MGFQWADVYTVTRLPAPLGPSLRGPAAPTAPPAQAVFLSGFPFLATNGTKSIIIDDLGNTGGPDTSYNGSVDVKIEQNTGNFAVGSHAAHSGTVAVPLVRGQGLLTVKAGATAGHLQLSLPSTLQSPSQSLALTSMATNAAQQVGWRMFTQSGQPVTGLLPAKSSGTFVVEPVNAQGQVVKGTAADAVGIQPNPVMFCPSMAEGNCNILGPYYVGTSGYTFDYRGTDTPVVFSLIPSYPAQAQVTQVIAPGDQLLTSATLFPRVLANCKRSTASIRIPATRLCWI